MNSIYMLFDTEANVFINIGSKVAWGSSGAAKNAFTSKQPYPRSRTTFEECKGSVRVFKINCRSIYDMSGEIID